VNRAIFKKIADVMRGFVGRTAVEPEEVCIALAALFRDENEHFNTQVFLTACGIDAEQAHVMAMSVDDE
jgi:hypothetical protein